MFKWLEKFLLNRMLWKLVKKYPKRITNNSFLAISGFYDIMPLKESVALAKLLSEIGFD